MKINDQSGIGGWKGYLLLFYCLFRGLVLRMAPLAVAAVITQVALKTVSEKEVIALFIYVVLFLLMVRKPNYLNLAFMVSFWIGGLGTLFLFFVLLDHFLRGRAFALDWYMYLIDEVIFLICFVVWYFAKKRLKGKMPIEQISKEEK